MFALRYFDSVEVKSLLLKYLIDYSKNIGSAPEIALESFVNLASVEEMYKYEDLIYSTESLILTKEDLFRVLCGFKNGIGWGLAENMDIFYTPENLLFRKLKEEDLCDEKSGWYEALDYCLTRSPYDFHDVKSLLLKWINGHDLEKKKFCISMIDWGIGLEACKDHLLNSDEEIILALLRTKPTFSTNQLYALKSYLECENADLQYWAAINIGLKNEKALNLLHEALDDMDEEISKEAKLLLGNG